MATNPFPKIGVEEYLLRERAASFKSEYYAGQMYAMSGASNRHSVINSNINGSLYSRLGQGCQAVSNDQRVFTREPLFTYPDTLIYCGQPEFIPDQYLDTLLNPRVIFEVLSKTTHDYDLGFKFEMYKGIPSFQEYLTVEQDLIHIQHWESVTQPNRWRHREYHSLQDAIDFFSVNLKLPVADVYRNIDLTPVSGA